MITSLDLEIAAVSQMTDRYLNALRIKQYQINV